MASYFVEQKYSLGFIKLTDELTAALVPELQVAPRGLPTERATGRGSASNEVRHG
jgi:hypothetical protein